MKTSHALGLAAGVGGSLFLTSLAPAPISSQPAINNCPAINFGAEDYFANTPATEMLSKLGAFTMGVIASKCVQGEATATHIGGDTMLLWQSQADAAFTGPDALTSSTYTLSVTGATDVSGAMDPTKITRFSVQEYVTKDHHSGPAAAVSAERVWSGWVTEVTQPFDGDPVYFAGNTGASIAERQAGDIVDLGKGIITDALEGDLVGNQRQG